jgi:hypothetical protein
MLTTKVSQGLLLRELDGSGIPRMFSESGMKSIYQHTILPEGGTLAQSSDHDSDDLIEIDKNHPGDKLQHALEGMIE